MSIEQSSGSPDALAQARGLAAALYDDPDDWLGRPNWLMPFAGEPPAALLARGGEDAERVLRWLRAVVIGGHHQVVLADNAPEHIREVQRRGDYKVVLRENANGPLIVGPVRPAEFADELRAAAEQERAEGRDGGDVLIRLAVQIEQEAASGGDVEPMLARARLLLGYAEEDAELLHDFGWGVDADGAAQMLGIEVDAVRKMIRSGEVLVVQRLGSVLLPRLQFASEGDGYRVLVGIREIVAAAVEAGAEGWHVLQWLVLQSEALGGRQPIDALRAGDVKAVVAVARAEV